jgi:hypothetical protein
MQMLEQGCGAVRAARASFDAWTDRHRPVLDTLRILSWFALAFGGPAYATYNSALANAAQGWCGSACLTMPGFHVFAAAVCGGVAVLAAVAYATLTAAAYATWLRPFLRHSRATHLADLGWLIMTLGLTVVITGALEGAHRHAGGVLFTCWWLGGMGVLELIWSKLAAERASTPD